LFSDEGNLNAPANTKFLHIETRIIFFRKGVDTMSKSQDSKKAVKKEPAKTPKEKKEAKKIKKEAMKRR
jgi:hypothetical protein